MMRRALVVTALWPARRRAGLGLLLAAVLVALLPWASDAVCPS